MVLEDVGNNAPDSFNDNPYPSSKDPYASISFSSGADRIDATTLPQPIPIVGPFIGFSKSAVRFKVETTLTYAERKIGRQLNSEEAQALAFHIYKLEQAKSYFATAGASAGIYQWYRTWDKVKYPFYQPKVEDINPNKFGPIKGPMAQYARHTWRFGLYALIAGQMGNIIGQLLAQPIAAMGTANDPKLEQFGVELKAASHADGQRTAQTGRDIEARRREFQEQVRNKSVGGPSPQASWGRPPPAKREDAGDDMSPTAGNEEWGSDGNPSAQSWETFSNDTSQPAPQRQQNPPSIDSWSRQPAPRQPAQSSSLPFDDDTSPTGGMFQDEVKSSQSQSTAGGSAWDRLRKGGAPTPTQRPSQERSRRAQPELREQRESSTLSDSFSFVEGDEERKRERERAQQEFDARLERERQGRDFNGDEGKKW